MLYLLVETRRSWDTKMWSIFEKVLPLFQVKLLPFWLLSAVSYNSWFSMHDKMWSASRCSFVVHVLCWESWEFRTQLKSPAIIAEVRVGSVVRVRELTQKRFHSSKSWEMNWYDRLWSLGEYRLAVLISLLLGSIMVVNRNLPSSSVLKEIVLSLLEQRVITPLLPPVPGETCTDPSQTLSNRIIFALWVSWRNIMQSFCLKLFLILLTVCNSLTLQVSPLQFTVTISRLDIKSSICSGPGLLSIPAMIRAVLSSFKVRILVIDMRTDTG